MTLTACGVAADKKEIAEAKKALQEVGDFAGEWKGNGEGKINGKNTLWKETLNWGWKFDKSGESWIRLEVKDGKNIVSGDLKYNVAKKVYEFTALDTSKKELVFEGTMGKKGLELTRTDKASGDVFKLTIFTLSDGARMMVQADVQSKGKGLFANMYKISASNAAESFAGGAKKPECIVTGGAGTMTVMHNGKTYYVCCSGCRDEFNANPKKFVDEFEKKNKK
jgi:ribosomal protein L24E